jgi:hypothetical protein
LRLLKYNMPALLEEVPLKVLPKTFREAVVITRALGLSYLWIDSLCIIQDSADDWASEPNRMREIYRNCDINLAAAASTNATGGLIHSSTLLSRVPCKVTIGMPRSQEEAMTVYTSGTGRHVDLPLFDIAWEESILLADH